MSKLTRESFSALEMEQMINDCAKKTKAYPIDRRAIAAIINDFLDLKNIDYYEHLIKATHLMIKGRYISWLRIIHYGGTIMILKEGYKKYLTEVIHLDEYGAGAICATLESDQVLDAIFSLQEEFGIYVSNFRNTEFSPLLFQHIYNKIK